jgi:uncharacterized RDD family membrane protein YckC
MTFDFGHLDAQGHQPNLSPSTRRAVGPGTWNGIVLASGGRRLIAFFFDGMLLLIGQAIAEAITGWSTWFTVPWLVFNHIFLQAYTGRSVGKMFAGLYLILPAQTGTREPARRPLPLGLAVLRFVCHIADLVFVISIPWLLYSEKRQMIADTFAGTLCVTNRGYEQVRLVA